MPAYKAYSKVKDTPNRNTRKGSRLKVYSYNRSLGSKLRKERRLAKEAALEAQQETIEE